jgi:mannose-6-phosphate isomerase
MTLYPLLLSPALHKRVWGGRRLHTLFEKALPGNDPYGESWEMHDSSVIANGALAGKTLADVLRDYGRDLIGAGSDPAQGVPLLVKLLDANDWLSVQVHPNDAQAAELEADPRGKTEAWYVLHADVGAQIVTGVKDGVTRDQMAQAIQDGELEALLTYEFVKTGDVIYMPANTVHALGPGLVVYEIQQSSDVTYRLYDWGRMGLDGKPRELHIEKGVRVSNVASRPPVTHTEIPGTMECETIVQSPYFITELCSFHEDHLMDVARQPGVSMEIYTCIEGSFMVRAEGCAPFLVSKGQTMLVPASVTQYEIQGTTKLLCSYPPVDQA